MNRKLIMIVTALIGALSLAHAQNEGGLGKSELNYIGKGYENTLSDRALRNAIIANGMTLSNPDRAQHIDEHFTYQVPNIGISNQEQSGRCWLFTGLNVLRAEVIAKHETGQFFFSHAYSFFWDQLEKSNLFLQGIIDSREAPMEDRTVEWLFRHPINDGGQFTGVSDNLVKYGLVPSEVMPETESSNNTGRLSAMIARYLRQTGVAIRKAHEQGSKIGELKQIKLDALQVIYRLLVLNLGEPPHKFTYTLRDTKGNAISTREYTPQSFYQEFVGRDLRDEYVMVMNDPSREYYKLYRIQYDRHLYDGKDWTYINVPMADLKEMAIASLKGGNMMYYSCDVGKELDRNYGLLSIGNKDYEAILGVPYTMNKKERIQTGDSGSTHAMTLVAVDLDEQGHSTRWMVENSWGAKSGFKGHLVMTDEWFDAYTFRVVVEKKYLTSKAAKVLKQKATLLPPWDPMFKGDE